MHLQTPVLGPDGVAGWDKVQDLAEHLVSLREEAYLDEQQVAKTIRLWTALADGDKRRLSYQPRHQARLIQGRFKAPKGSRVTPGVESVKRCLIGHPGGPAQWPSTSRLVEAMCIKLCALHKSPTKKDGVTTPRWTKILRDYHHIRDLVLNCPTVMEATSLQLYVLNQRTLIQWFQRRETTQELSVLQQGLAAETHIVVARSELPAPRERMAETPSTSGPQHQFVLPPNRAGQAPKLRPGRRAASAAAVRPLAPAAPHRPLPVPAQLLCLPAPVPQPGLVILGNTVMAPTAAPTRAPRAAPSAAPSAAPTRAPRAAPSSVLSAAPTRAPSAAPRVAPSAAPSAAPTRAPSAAPRAAPSAAPSAAPTRAPSAAQSSVLSAPTSSSAAASSSSPTDLAAPVAPGPPVSRYTQRNRRRRAEEEASGASKRKYVREVAFNTCSKCGQPKTKEFGHSRFGKSFFCALSSGGQTLEEWLAEQRLKAKPPS